MKDNLRRLGYYGVGVLSAAILVIVLVDAPGVWPYAWVGLVAGVPLGFLTPPRRRKRDPKDMTLLLTAVGGALLAQLARSLIHDQQLLMGLGALLGGGLVGWDLVWASRTVLDERVPQ